MPPLTRYFLKAGLIHLMISLVAGLLVAVASITDLFPSWFSGLQVSFFHLFTVGWITQLIFGVAIWLFPVFDKANPRGNPVLGWLSFAFLNLGILLRVLMDILLATGCRSAAVVWGVTLAALLQWLAASAFVLIISPRIRERKRRK